VIQESGHLMHLDAPQAVVEAVLDVINAIRNEKRSD
jgi:hypothetical protein